MVEKVNKPKDVTKMILPDELVGKSVLIKLVGTKVPQYTFTGEWTGKDITAAVTNIRRAYLQRNQDIRRAAQTNKEDLA